MADWCSEREIELRFIEPGEPNQNAHIERFNRTYRHEVLNACLFENLNQVREISSQWLASTTRSGYVTRWEACRQRYTATRRRGEKLSTWRGSLRSLWRFVLRRPVPAML